MRIAQLIDSLQPGGAERMAVNYANALANKIEFSGLVATRAEGGLKSDIGPGVKYDFLDKKSAFDVKALRRLKTYCKRHDVDILHAHGSSFFMATIIKLWLPKLTIIWHDHNGARSTQTVWQNLMLLLCARFFGGIIAVNKDLEHWARRNLKVDDIIYLPNFALANKQTMVPTKLHGTDGKRILMLANLREPKNHQLALEVAIILQKRFPEWTYHFIGNDLHDDYSARIKTAIATHKLDGIVYIYGLKHDVSEIIEQSDICILTSRYEGLPVALIEYGSHKKPVVATAVGEIPSIIRHGQNGFIVAVDDAVGFANSLSALMEDDELRARFSSEFYRQIEETYSEQSVISKYICWIQKNYGKQ